MKNKSKGDPILREAMETANEAEAAYAFSEWLGAIFFYLTQFGGLKFSDIFHAKNKRRNIWTGYFLQLLLIALGAWILIKFFMPV